VFIGMGRRPSIVSVPLSVWQAGLWLASPLLPGATGAMGARMAQDLVFDAAAGLLFRYIDFVAILVHALTPLRTK
jgi:hypothetical protein